MPKPYAKHLTSLPISLGDAPNYGPRTVVCFGTARGGTSMVAGAILGLGVPMGPDLGRNLEDPEFNFDRQNKPLEAFVDHARAVIAVRNAAHGVWGWKFPNAGRYLQQIIGDIRAPHLVCVYRDPVPMALRRTKTAAGAGSFIATRLRAQIKNTALVEEIGAPCLMVSYEKAAAYPLVFLQELSAFLNLPLPAHVAEIVSFMKPGSYKAPDDLLSHL